jgi:hypothetical protein
MLFTIIELLNVYVVDSGLPLLRQFTWLAVKVRILVPVWANAPPAMEVRMRALAARPTVRKEMNDKEVLESDPVVVQPSRCGVGDVSAVSR